MTRQFTGRDMTVIMVAFFAVVIAVNVVMARSAIASFGGVVVSNSYVASQKFNGWLAEADAQDRLGWHARAAAPDKRLTLDLTGPNGAIGGAEVTVEAEHPLGRLKGQSFRLTEQSPGHYSAPHSLPPGRWRLRIEARAPAGKARFVREIRL